METTAVPLLFQLGVVGVVLAWLMFRVEKRMERVELALDRLTRTQLLTLLARPDVEETVKSQVRSILAEMNVGPAGDFAAVVTAQKPL